MCRNKRKNCFLHTVNFGLSLIKIVQSTAQTSPYRLVKLDFFKSKYGGKLRNFLQDVLTWDQGFQKMPVRICIV